MLIGDIPMYKNRELLDSYVNGNIDHVKEQIEENGISIHDLVLELNDDYNYDLEDLLLFIKRVAG